MIKTKLCNRSGKFKEIFLKNHNTKAHGKPDIFV